MQRTLRSDDAGVVEGQMQRTKLINSKGHRCLINLRQSEVAAKSNSFSALADNFVSHGLCGLLVQVGNHHGCTFCCESKRGCLANAGSATCDQCGFVCESGRHDVLLLLEKLHV